MIFEDVLNGSLKRQGEARYILCEAKRIGDSSGPLSSDPVARIQKGIFFVPLYGAVEYTLTQCCMIFIAHIKAKPYLALDYKNKLMAIVLSSEFEALSSCNPKERWKKKVGIIDELYSNDRSNLNESVFPGESSNIGNKQLLDVWDYFHLSGYPFDSERNVNLDEIKNKRNEIAHGRNCAEDVGKGYTINELEKKLKAVENLCEYIVEAFEESCDRELFLKHA